METIISTEEKVKVVEMQEVVKEEYSVDELKQELESINSEIKNYETIVANRLEFITSRKARLEELLSINKSFLTAKLAEEKTK